MRTPSTHGCRPTSARCTHDACSSHAWLCKRTAVHTYDQGAWGLGAPGGDSKRQLERRRTPATCPPLAARRLPGVAWMKGL